jgi:hypothetical protein
MSVLKVTAAIEGKLFLVTDPSVVQENALLSKDGKK